MSQDTYGEVTRLLDDWRGGESQAIEDLLPLVYDELRVLAAGYLRKERQGHTLQSTALVHEAFVRITKDSPLQLNNRTHFFAVAAQAMRRILVDHARRHHAQKRFGAQDKVTLEEAPQLAHQPDPRLLAIHEALEQLASVNERQAKLVELRYFGGLTNVEAAEVLQISKATVERDWNVARLWLKRRLS